MEGREQGEAAWASSTKALAMQAIGLPDDAGLDDVIDTLQFVYEVQRGLDDLNAGRTVTQTRSAGRMAAWLA
ncbi:MAG: hypothetical protein U0531_03965 [Dehalococcoidia bacterium]